MRWKISIRRFIYTTGTDEQCERGKFLQGEKKEKSVNLVYKTS